MSVGEELGEVMVAIELVLFWMPVKVAGMARGPLAALHSASLPSETTGSIDAGISVPSAHTTVRPGRLSGKCSTIGVQHLEEAAAAESAGELLKGDLTSAVIRSECVVTDSVARE